MKNSSRTYLAVSLVFCVVAVSSCEENGEDPPKPGGGPGLVPATPSARRAFELPTMASRLAFHEVGYAAVGAGAHYEIRASQGAVRFTPGVASGRGHVIAGSALTFRTVMLGREGEAASVGIDQSIADGGLVIHHEMGDEYWVDDERAAQQSFFFEVPPSGEGDLVVRVDTSGLDCVEGPEGLRFTDSVGAVHVAYSHASFIDAVGIETAVPAACDESGITLRVPAHVVDGAQYPAVLDPVVAPSFELTDPVSASTNGRFPSVACSDATCLVAFVDDRDGTTRRYAGRFTPAGVLLDDLPLIVGGPPAGGDRLTRVGFVQDRFVLVYKQGTTAFAQLVSEAGAPIGVPSVVANGINGNNFELACGTTDCLLTWLEDPASVTRLRANHIALDGSVPSPAGFVLSTAASAAYPVRFAQGRYLVTYRPIASAADGAMNAVRVQNGVVLDATPISVIAQSFVKLEPIGVATDGTDFFVTVKGPGSSNNPNRRGTFISNDGQILPPGPEFLMQTPAITISQDFAFAWNGAGYSTVYDPFAGSTELFTFVTSPLGIASSSAVPIKTLDAFEPTLAPLPSGGAVVGMSSGFTVVSPMFGRLLDDAGQPAGSLYSIAHGHNDQTATAVARGVGQYFVVWIDRRLTSAYVVGARVAADGTVLDPSGIVIARISDETLPTQLAEDSLDVVWNGSSFFVTWTDRTDDVMSGLSAARVTGAGVLLDPTPIMIAPGRDWLGPAVAWNGVVHMIAYRTTPSPSGYRVARVDAAGNVLDAPGIVLDFLSSGYHNPQIAWTGSEFLVTVGYGYRTVSGAGVPQQPAVVPFPGFLEPFAMACTGASCSFTAASGANLQSIPFNAVTKTLGTPTTVGAITLGNSSDVVWDGSRFVVAYGTNDLTAWSLGATPVSIESSPSIAAAPSLASLGANQSLLAYTLQDLAPGAVTRVYGTIIDGGAENGVACSVAGDCESGFCVEGVCCSAACGGNNPNDCQACTVAAGAAVDGICAPLTTSTVCRAANGVCDAAETCDGVSGTCPADGFLVGTVCRAAIDLCDAPELCNGAGTQCPANGVLPAGTVCRASVGECDVAESCNGSSTVCPPDAAAVVGTMCVGTPNACATQACAGTVGASASCQATPRPAGFVCRAAAGPCDVGETCDGSGSPCPMDLLRPVGEVCRAAAGACDLAEACDGVGADCPSDGKVAGGTECRAANGECDVAEACDGASSVCPADVGAAAGTPCGPTPVGACELESSCVGGSSTVCEPNYAPAGVPCRAAAGPCDAEETCDGATANCPGDALREAGAVCAAKDPTNDCDVDDVCDGIDVACAATVAEDGASCDTGGTCQAGVCESSGEGGSGAGGSGSNGGSSPAGGNGPGAGGGPDRGGSGPGTSTTGGGDSTPSEDGCSCQTPRRRSFGDSVGGLSLVAALVAAGSRGRRERRRATGTRRGQS